MPDTSTLHLGEAERAELEAVAASLTRSPRLTRLLRFLGEKYFSGLGERLSEYDIATEVFDRSKSTFDPSVDAIARVEAHRLRKKLREYYSGEGGSHPVRIELPSGTYALLFRRLHRPVSEPTPPLEEPSDTAPLPPPAVECSDGLDGLALPEAELPGEEVAMQVTVPVAEAPLKPWLPASRWTRIALIGGALGLAALGVLLLLRPGRAVLDAALASGKAGRAEYKGSFDARTGPVRIMAGYFGPAQTDSTGAVWQPDAYYRNGGTWRRVDAPMQRTNRPILFSQWRTGDFFYDIPLKPGAYELHLYFSTLSQDNDSATSFTVGINGQTVLSGFDINVDALGPSVADERVFRDVSPSPDGFLHLAFTSERGAPSVNAIEILPGNPHQQLPIRLVTQTTGFTDRTGHVWSPDDFYMNGRLNERRQAVSGTGDPDLYATERYGHFTYAIPVDTRDRYTLVLHFAELYFGAEGPGAAGMRRFRVMCNGATLLDDFDIYKEAGSLHALTKTFSHLKPTAQGKLNLIFEPITNNATVSGIEVLDESK